MDFKKILAIFQQALRGLNIQNEEESISEQPKIDVQKIKYEISQGNFKFLNKILNNDPYLQQIIHGHPGIYHNLLHHLIEEAFTYKNPDFIHRVHRCSVSDFQSKYKKILLCFISAGKDIHFKIQRQIRIPFMFSERPWEGSVTLLMDAILQRASHEVICALINAGSDVNASTEDGTPLIYAMRYHYDKDVFDELLKRGSNVNQRDHKGQTPLFHAINLDDSFVTMLISAGANVNERDDAGKNILMCIPCNCINGHNCTAKRKVDLLINNGININNIDNSGNRLIHITCCRYLLDLTVEYGIEAKNHKGLTALMEATVVGNANKVNYLLLSGANPNCVDQESNTPLNFIFTDSGVYISNYSMVNSLLYYGADLYFHNAEGQTPFDFILNNNHSYYLYSDHDEDDDILYGCLKYFLLFNENCIKLRDNFYTNFEDIFVENCKKELNLMQMMYLKDALTYYDFCILKKFNNSKYVDISDHEYKLKCKEINELFPLYKDIINIRLESCYSKTKNIYLRKWFEKIALGLYTVSEVGTYIDLNYNCLDHVCRYLNNNDMYNILYAAIRNSEV